MKVTSFKLRQNGKVLEGKTGNYWVKIKTTGKGFFHVLIGKKGDKKHSHLGINADGSYKFLESRKRINSIKQRITNKRTLQSSENEIILENLTSNPKFQVEISTNARISQDGTISCNLERVTIFEKIV